MSSGTLRDLTRAINASCSTLTLPLPEDLIDIIQAYVEKHTAPDESDEKRLQDELLSIYQASILGTPSRIAPFLAILRLLKPSLRAPGRLLQWWDKLSPPVMVYLGMERGLASEVKGVLLDILVNDEDGEESQRKSEKTTSDALAENLITTWLAKSKLATEEFDDHAKFIEEQIGLILLEFGKKRPQNFLMAINKFFVKSDSRILALSLLCQFFRHQPPHLHQLLQTPLFDNLLRCLQIDTSTRAISLSMTALIMFLPHIPTTASQHLPALFNIYSRLLFWDRERRATEPQRTSDDDDDEKSESSGESRSESSWEKLTYILESEDENVPELLHYFTFLYGLYPINFMSYIRKPQRYLRHANFPGADDIDIEPAEIRLRSEPFRQVHLLHPNFFHLTIESEITDCNRWSKSLPSDVVTECMALYVPSEDGHEHAARARGTMKKPDPNSDIPDQPLLEKEMVTPYQSRHTSWRNTTSTAVTSPEGYRHSSLHRKLSQTSQSMPSIADSPSVRPTDYPDSPTLPPQMINIQNNQLSEMLGAQKSIRGSMYQAVANDSVASLALSNTIQDPSQVDSYLASLTRDNIPRSPSLRPRLAVPAEASLQVAYLNREIQLLKNDLNFERYLKHQHLSHIGQLRRKQIREARAEAETQNLINHNRSLKSKLEDAKNSNLQMKKETEKSRAHARKWETVLSGRLRVLKDEEKKWNIEREKLTKDLEIASENVKGLRQIVVTSERNELAAKQQLASVESSRDELDRLRKEVEGLYIRIRKYEAGERSAMEAKENEMKALSRIEMLTMEIRARDLELVQTKKAFEEELAALSRTIRSKTDDDQKEIAKKELTYEVINSALATSRNRILELKKAHNSLLQRYSALQSGNMDLREQLQKALLHDGAPLGTSPRQPISPSPIQKAFPRRKHSSSDPERFEPFSAPPTGPLPPIPQRPKLDTSHRANTVATPSIGRSPTSATTIVQPQFFQVPQPYSPPGTPIALMTPVKEGKASGSSEMERDRERPNVLTKTKTGESQNEKMTKVYPKAKGNSYFRI